MSNKIIIDDSAFIDYAKSFSHLLGVRIGVGDIHNLSTLKSVFRMKNIELKLLNHKRHPVYSYIFRSRMIENAIIGFSGRTVRDQKIDTWLLGKLRVQHAYLKINLPNAIDSNLAFYRALLRPGKGLSAKEILLQNPPPWLRQALIPSSNPIHNQNPPQ